MLKNTKPVVYFDMDGVLADFDGAPRALDRFKTEKGFFQSLEPLRSGLNRAKSLIDRGFQVYILTASPNSRADYDKRRWLEKHLPTLKRSHFIAVRLGACKADYVRDKGAVNVLFDDYFPNLNAWRSRGYIAFEFHGEK